MGRNNFTYFPIYICKVEVETISSRGVAVEGRLPWEKNGELVIQQPVFVKFKSGLLRL